MWRHQQEHTEGKGLSACVNGIQISKSSESLHIYLHFPWAHGFGQYWDSIGSNICTRIDALAAMEGLEKGIPEIYMWSLTQRTGRDNYLDLSSIRLHRIHPNNWTRALKWPKCWPDSRSTPALFPDNWADLLGITYSLVLAWEEEMRVKQVLIPFLFKKSNFSIIMSCTCIYCTVNMVQEYFLKRSVMSIPKTTESKLKVCVMEIGYCSHVGM